MSKLPRKLPLIPIRGLILLPRLTIPVPLFDDEKIAEFQRFARRRSHVGIVQPQSSPYEDDLSRPVLFKTGCVGRILSVTSLNDDVCVATIQGICRFDILEENEEAGIFHRRALVSYERYLNDLAEDNDVSIDRLRLMRALKPYLEQFDIAPNWDEIEHASNEKLINILAMVCPFEPQEKQALLETPGLKEQSQIMTMLFEMGAYEDTMPPRYH